MPALFERLLFYFMRHAARRRRASCPAPRGAEGAAHAFRYDRAEIYTEFGLDYLRKNSMLHVLRRHYPHLAPSLDGVENAFAPWKKIQGPPANE